MSSTEPWAAPGGHAAPAGYRGRTLIAAAAVTSALGLAVGVPIGAALDRDDQPAPTPTPTDELTPTPDTAPSPGFTDEQEGKSSVVADPYVAYALWQLLATRADLAESVKDNPDIDVAKYAAGIIEPLRAQAESAADIYTRLEPQPYDADDLQVNQGLLNYIEAARQKVAEVEQLTSAQQADAYIGLEGLLRSDVVFDTGISSATQQIHDSELADLAKDVVEVIINTPLPATEDAAPGEGEGYRPEQPTASLPASYSTAPQRPSVPETVAAAVASYEQARGLGVSPAAPARPGRSMTATPASTIVAPGTSYHTL